MTLTCTMGSHTGAGSKAPYHAGTAGNPLILAKFPVINQAAAAPPPRLSRNAVIVIAAVLLHVGALWALQSGLLRRAVEVLVPVQMLSDFIEPPAPKEAPPPKPLPPVIKQPVLKAVVPVLPPPPMPVAILDTAPSPNAPTGVIAPQPALAPINAPVAVVASPPAAPPAPPAPPKVDLPSSDADYLQNAKATYPAMSKRLGEQGQVIHSILIGVDGLPVSAKLVKSSGFDRLDAAAYKALMSWRYAPGKRNGVAAAMTYNASISFVLE